MPFSVVLDTCVLYPAPLRDTLLRLAERGPYRALWSVDIVDELRRNLIDDGLRAPSIDHLLTAMGTAFPDAEVSGYRSLIHALACDPKDRHVLAAAVRAAAAAIVTFNIRAGDRAGSGSSSLWSPSDDDTPCSTPSGQLRRRATWDASTTRATWGL